MSATVTPAGQTPKPILCVVGARPNYMKMAPIIQAMAAHHPPIPALLIHTGQHYDSAMNDQFFLALGLPAPTVNLEVGSASHAMQTAEIMKRFEPVVDQYDPAAVLVVGDVNSTIACALVASKKNIPVIHVEAGLRSYDRTMPEEINRVLTDQIADLLYTTERSAGDNLRREGIADERIVFVGNVMIDTLLTHKPHAVAAEKTLRNGGASPAFLTAGQYGVVTMHRPSNVDDPQILRGILDVLQQVSSQLPLAFTMHPRTRQKIQEFGLESLIQSDRIVLLPPQGYFEMLGLMAEATLVLTDSGGLQDETTALGVPCLTMRNNTERPITVDQGTSTLVGQDAHNILTAVEDVLKTGGKRGRTPEYWDGHAAERIARHLGEWLGLKNLKAA